MMDIAKLIRLLEKRAKGFSYSEVQEEFASGKETETKKDKNLFDLALETKEMREVPNKNFGAQIEKVNNGVIESPPKRKRGRPRKNPLPNNTIETKKCEDNKDGNLGMVLVKRKVHTFFVPPDMTAIKMLIEFEGRPVEAEDDVTELANKRRALLEEIRRELLGDEDYEN